MRLPEAFIQDIKPYLPADEMDVFCEALANTEASTCIRINAKKIDQTPGLSPVEPLGENSIIPWNPNVGRYLKERPLFTLDPLLHGGAYYVQEAASQFVSHVLETLLKKQTPVTMLDLCAAPGGKSTAALSVLPEGSLLVSNEIDHRRSRILSENVTKWGYFNVIVTGNAPADFSSLTHLFDVLLCDVPCSGEGMFRKDEGAIDDWSPNKVEGCVKLQREILSDIWPVLKPGGIMIYSTCTFNVHEDEEQLQYICNELGADPIIIPTEASWNIHKPLIEGIPCYRFMPHYTHGEGLFMAVLRKKEADDDGLVYSQMSFKTNKKNKKEALKCKKGSNGKDGGNRGPVIDMKKITQEVQSWVLGEGSVELTADNGLRFIPSGLKDLHEIIQSRNLYVLQSGIELGTIKGRDITPSHALALSLDRNPEAFPYVELDKETALNYLRREAIVLPADAPVGFVLVTYQHLPLGFVKNIGNRSNNLYPQEWRIRYS